MGSNHVSVSVRVKLNFRVWMRTEGSLRMRECF